MVNGNSNVEGRPPIFSAILTPYRSLDRNGFRVLMICVGAICFVSGLPFLLLGAWPVFLFFTLDVFLVWFAFRLNYRSARAFEQVEVFAESVTIRQVSARGKVATHEFNPYWARLSVHEIEDEGVARITLTSHGRSLDVGAFLNPPDKQSFAAAFRNALMQARGVATA